MDIFGRSGGKLGVLLKDAKAMENAKNLIGGQADILDKHAQQFDRASDVLNQTGTKIQGFFVGVGAKIIEQILPAIEFINQIDLTGIGERFGAALARALDVVIAIVRVFREMSLGEIAQLFGVLLRLGISKAINFLFAFGTATFSALIALFVQGIKNSIAFLGVLSTKDFWSGMLNVLIGIAQAFGSFFAKRIASAITAIKNAMPKIGNKIFGDSDKRLAETGNQMGASAKESFAKAGTDLTPAFNVLKERMSETGKAVKDAFTKTFSETPDMIDTSGDEATVGGIVGNIKKVADEIKKEREAKKKVEDGAAGDASGGASGDSNGLPALNSRLAGAINTIAGRNANAVIAAESAKTSANTERTAKATEEMAKKMGENGTAKPKPKATAAAGAGRFV